MRGIDDILLQNAIPSNVQLVQVWAGGGAEVSRPEIRKIHLAVLPYIFYRAAPGRVLGPHILAHEGGRLSASKKIMVLPDLFVHLSLYSQPRLENIGRHLLPL